MAHLGGRLLTRLVADVVCTGEIGPHVQPEIHLVPVPDRDSWICELVLK